MNKKLIPEIERILASYNGEKIITHYQNELNNMWENNDYTPIKLDDFEEKIDWDWVSKNYHVSYDFIYKYQHKLNMKYLYNNFIITPEEFKKIRNREEISDRFEILDIR